MYISLSDTGNTSYLYHLFIFSYNQLAIILTCFHACDHNPLQIYHNHAQFNIFCKSIL